MVTVNHGATAASVLADPDCPTRGTLDLVGDKWSVLVIVTLAEEPLRFAELRRRIGGVSQKMLTQTLRRLERNGLVKRTAYPIIPPHVEYRLTAVGVGLCGPLQELRRW